MSNPHDTAQTGGDDEDIVETVETKAEVIRVFGSHSQAHKALGISQSALSQWPEVLGRHHKNVVLAALYPVLVRKYRRLWDRYQLLQGSAAVRSPSDDSRS